MQAGSEKPLRVFWSYSHRDEALRDELHEHLAGLRRGGLIADWHDRKIGAGKVWKDEIDRHLGDADIVLLLVSASFIASEYCWGDEMAKALARHDTDEARVIPVLLRPCDWLDTPIARLQAVPKDARPITQWADRDVAYVDIASAIRAAVGELIAVRAKPEPVPPAPPHPDPLPQTGEGRGDAKVPSPTTVPPTAASAQLAPHPPAGAGLSLFRGREKVGVRTFKDLEVFRDGDVPWCPEMVVIPARSFLMGSPPDEPDRSKDEGPQHKVMIARRFAIGKHAVTFAEYDHFCDVTKRKKPLDQRWGRGRRPVINVSWRDAKAYAEWLSRDLGRAYRLPTEAEWEYACRAGTMTPFSCGRTITPDQANYNGSYVYGNGPKGIYREKTVPVGSLPPNPWGLYEMHGNVWEWVEDLWHDDYANAPADGKAWTDVVGINSDRRVIRGGSWITYPMICRSAFRNGIEPDRSSRNLGFRLARTLS